MAFWEPWRGCHRTSEGCRYCFVFQSDKKKNVDTNQIVKLPSFNAPIEKLKNGQYKIKSKATVYTCFHSDFFIEEADEWREDCWKMIRERKDCHFIFLTKRIERFDKCRPKDWGEGYPNVTIGVSVENQKMADARLSILKNLPIIHKNIICQPLIGEIDLSNYLKDIELVMVGGEYHEEGRILDYEWVLKIREQCKKEKVDFQFRQCATSFKKEDKIYHLSYRQLFQMAKKADINLKF